MMNETEQRYTDDFRCELEKYKKEAEEFEYQYNRVRSENEMLKERVMSKIELKPCPFCGGEVSMVYSSREKAFKFYHRNGGDEDRCRVIDVIRLRGSSLKDAAEAWNRRAE